MRPADEDILRCVRGQKDWVSDLFDELRAGSTEADGITRDTFGAGEQFGHRVIEGRAREMGLAVQRDHGANLYMHLAGRDRKAPRIMMGSHMDSVRRGGNFDGAAGVIAGLVATRALQALGMTPTCDVTTMAIRAEESVWFQVSYVGSRTAFGVLPDGALEAGRVDTGRTLAEHMADCGADIDKVRANKAWLRAEDIRAFVEVHIEQAPQLIEAGLALAIGTGVPGNFRYPSIRFEGEYAHVGLPRRFRKDAAVAASTFALGLDEMWLREEAAGRPMAFTIGRFHTNPDEHALTIVPGEMSVSLDVRAYEAGHLAGLEREVLALAKKIEAERGVQILMGPRASADVAPSTPVVFDGLTASAERLGIPAMPLASPASHDAATFTVAGVPTAMLFVRNENGSHNPREAMEIDDFMETCAVLTGWLVEEATKD
ncbi:MAG TPA: Zn-dependent hydrolase [Hyphomicrobiaceae bacterium]|nr:Zn-dependent hydrolase [Hyphomicrobiaceae bacterium]